ncbi:hypothetical protein ACFW5S_10945 [Streptomyces olivaceus]|uniref:hypothetical protein n=1 Tax=Streptomyces olivaceus TaxID=47716 RepID=UPI0036C01B6E
MAVTAWAAGQRITADRLNEMLPRWQSWTPTWTTSTGANTPSFGNATLNCEYCRSGDLVLCQIQIVFGTTTNFGTTTGTDNWRFSLPVTAAATTNAAGHFALTQSNDLRWYGRARLTTVSVFEIEMSSGRADGNNSTQKGLIDSVSPETWASGHTVYGSLMYKAA